MATLLDEAGANVVGDSVEITEPVGVQISGVPGGAEILIEASTDDVQFEPIARLQDVGWLNDNINKPHYIRASTRGGTAATNISAKTT